MVDQPVLQSHAATVPAPGRGWTNRTFLRHWTGAGQPACWFETGWFLTLGVADMVMTTILLETGMVSEVNPLARFFLFLGGLHGMVGYKCATLVVASVCAQFIMRQRPQTARAVLHTGIWVQLVVVVYSVVLLVLVDE